MDPIPCSCCGEFFVPSPRHKNQNFCQKTKCQKSKKAEWQRNKIRTDPEYAANQKQSNAEWLQNNPDYWKNYRQNNPEKTARNRLLQTIRNRRRTEEARLGTKMDTSLIAKMDASKRNDFELVGQFWLVPMIAKMDALKIFLRTIPAGYG